MNLQQLTTEAITTMATLQKGAIVCLRDLSPSFRRLPLQATLANGDIISDIKRPELAKQFYAGVNVNVK